MKTPKWFQRMVVPLANKIVYASDAYVTLKSTLVNTSPELIDFSRPPDGAADLRLLEFARFVKPMTGSNLRKVRVGSEHDGGYVMADDFDVAGAISVGIGSNVSWDRAITQKGIPVAMFDPTIRRLPDPVPGGRFFRVGLGSNLSGDPYKPLSGLVEMAGFPDTVSLLLKIDIEGAEYEALSSVSEFDLSIYRQVTIEFHNLSLLSGEETGKPVLQTVEKLSKSHFPVHVHANNYDSIVRFGNFWFPNAIEVTYLIKNRLADPVPSVQVRDSWDRPCDPRVADIDLEGLGGNWGL